MVFIKNKKNKLKVFNALVLGTFFKFVVFKMPKKARGYKASTLLGDVSYPSKNNTDQEYGCVKKILGGSWITVKCSDGFERRCHICGALQRFKSNTTKIVQGDIILISKRDNKTGDVVMKYPPEVARKKIKSGEIVIDMGGKDDDTTVDGVEFVEEEEFDFNTI